MNNDQNFKCGHCDYGGAVYNATILSNEAVLIIGPSFIPERFKEIAKVYDHHVVDAELYLAARPPGTSTTIAFPDGDRVYTEESK